MKHPQIDKESVYPTLGTERKVRTSYLSPIFRLEEFNPSPGGRNSRWLSRLYGTHAGWRFLRPELSFCCKDTSRCSLGIEMASIPLNVYGTDASITHLMRYKRELYIFAGGCHLLRPLDQQPMRSRFNQNSVAHRNWLGLSPTLAVPHSFSLVTS